MSLVCRLPVFCFLLSDQGLHILSLSLHYKIWDVGTLVLKDSFPWVSCISACLVTRSTDYVLEYLFLKNLYTVKSLGRQKYCHLLKQKAGLLTSLEARHNFTPQRVHLIFSGAKDKTCLPSIVIHCMYKYHLVFFTFPWGIWAWGNSTAKCWYSDYYYYCE